MVERIAPLLRRSEFLRVAAARRKWAAPGLVLQAYRPPQTDRDVAGAPPLRVGYTASKKVGGAVARNRAKRPCSGWARTDQPGEPADRRDKAPTGAGRRRGGRNTERS
jgi:ribonuclease P protein component